MEHKVYLRRMAEAKIAQYREEQIVPREAIALIDAGTFHYGEFSPNGFMVDCTTAERARNMAQVALLDSRIKMWERDLA